MIKYIIIESIASLIFYFGGLHLFKWILRKKSIFIVCNYHNFNRYNNYRFKRRSILETGYSKNFENQIRFFAKHCNFCYPEEFIAHKQSNKPNILLTFDDGYKDNYSIAFPILARYKAKAIFFIVSNFIGTNKWLWHDEVRYLAYKKHICSKEAEGILKSMNSGNEVPKSYKEKIEKLSSARESKRLMMNWKEITELLENGFYVGAHTSNHRILSFLSNEQQEYEIKTCIKSISSNLAEDCIYFAYPNGLYNNHTIELLIQHEIKFAFSTNRGFNKHVVKKMELKRIGLNASDSIPMILLKFYINLFK